MEKFVLVGNPWASLFTLGTEHLEIFKFNHPLLGNRERVKRRKMIDLHSLKIGDKAIVHTIYGDYIDTVEEIIPDSDREFGFGVVFKECGLIQDDEDVSPYKEDKQ
ncbi:MAG: hypothetical protein UH541_03970 [Prevotella sp.]|nr:hypothetical protein [Prevotella sp.]